MKFGERLKLARIRADLTQEQVIKQIGVTRQSLSNWENDRTYPDLASVVKLSDLYQVSNVVTGGSSICASACSFPLTPVHPHIIIYL